MLMLKAKNLEDNVYNIYVATVNQLENYDAEALTQTVKTIFNHKGDAFEVGRIELEDMNKPLETNISHSFLNKLTESAEYNLSLLAIPVTDMNLKLINGKENWLLDLFSKCKSPILTFKKIKPEKIETIIAAIDLEIDFMPFIFRLQKLMQSMKNVNLHIVSALKKTNHFNISKATQQLSFLNELLSEEKINFTAEIVYSQNEEISKFCIILDYIKRVNADIVLINKNSFSNNNHFDSQTNLFELLSKSETPIITFV